MKKAKVKVACNEFKMSPGFFVWFGAILATLFWAAVILFTLCDK
jgi:hypothetical protein